MYKVRIKEKGVILFIVLATIFIVILLGNIILGIVSSQSRLTHHKLSRIQAYYASWAGINYALEQLRTGVWNPTSNCQNPGGCLIPDPDFPNSILSFDGTSAKQVRVIFCPAGTKCADAHDACAPPVGSGINFCINSTVRFTYTP